jgi:polyhydroxyalkanoate synthesis regulator phasin
MKIPNSIKLATALGALLGGTAHGQEPAAQIDLSRVRSTFRAADTDKDGTLDAGEVKAAGIPGTDFLSQDVDKNGSLSGEEFVTYYRQLLVRAGRTVAKDIDTEVARIQAARRTQQAKDAQKGPQSDAPKGDAKPAVRGPAAGRRGTDERLARAKAALDGKRDDVRVQKSTDDERVAAARDQATAERVQAARDERRAERVQDARDEKTAERIEAAREAVGGGSEAPAAGMTPAERAERAASDAQRAADMRAKQKQQSGGTQQPADAEQRTEAKKPADPQVTAPGETPARRAQQYVKRLVEQGRLTPEQARDFYALLSAGPVAGAQDAAGPAELRAALLRARPRIGELVQKGFLTAEEGRELSSALDARATAAAKAVPKPEEEPVREPPGADPGKSSEAGERGGPAGARRAQQARGQRGEDPTQGEGNEKKPAAKGERVDPVPSSAPPVKAKREGVKPVSRGEVPARKPGNEDRNGQRGGGV